jgi:hypothetical protein
LLPRSPLPRDRNSELHTNPFRYRLRALQLYTAANLLGEDIRDAGFRLVVQKERRISEAAVTQRQLLIIVQLQVGLEHNL